MSISKSQDLNVDNGRKKQSDELSANININLLTNKILNNKTNDQISIDILISKLQSDGNYQDINDSETFKSKLKDKKSKISKLIKLLKNRDNQKYFLSLCEEGEKITFTLFSRILQKCSFVEQYVKQQNALVVNYYSNLLAGLEDDHNKYNRVIIVDQHNKGSEQLKKVFKSINNICIRNHARDYYGEYIGTMRKKQVIQEPNTMQIFTYNAPSKWFWPTIAATEQRATAQAELLSHIIDSIPQEAISLSSRSVCSGNYFCFDLLKKGLKNSNKQINIEDICIFNIIENGLLHMGAEDIARKFIEFVDSLSQTDAFVYTAVRFAHGTDFFHKNGCKEFADALKNILNNNKEKYKNVIDIIKNHMRFDNMKPIKDKYVDFCNDQLNYFNDKIKEISNKQPQQNTTTIHRVNANDKVSCCCFGN